jgi:hypothetical protein
VAADDTVEGVTFARESDTLRISLELDDVANHPFHYESRCRKSWHEKAPSLEHSARFRAAGETATYSLVLGEASPTFEPLIKQRLPSGFRAAFVVTDHADQSSKDTLRALLYGASDERAPGYGHGGFLGHHLAFTKSLFWNSAGAARPQLEDQTVRKLAGDLLAAGSEVIPHSATPKRDTRAVTEEALKFFHELGAHTWIDHQVETNCEAFTDQGWHKGSPYYIADLLARYGIRYVWSGREPPPPDRGLNLLAPARPEVRVPWLYGHGPDGKGGPRLFLWRSLWMYLPARAFYSAYAPDQLDALERERGIHVAHTYLESLHDSGPHKGRQVLVRTPEGQILTSAAFETLLGDLEQRQRRGTLWVTPIGKLADHLLRSRTVITRYQPDGTVVLTNLGDSPAAAVTFTVPCPGRGCPTEEPPVLVDGTAPAHHRQDSDGYSFWLDLAPGREVRVTYRTSAPVPPPAR